MHTPRSRGAAPIAVAASPPIPLSPIQVHRGEPEAEAFRTFNMGIGMILVVRPGDADRAVAHFRRAKFPAAVIGEIRKGRGEARVAFVGEER